MIEIIETAVTNKLMSYIARHLQEEEPTNVMGASTATGSPIAGFDPILKIKIGKRKKPDVRV